MSDQRLIIPLLQWFSAILVQGDTTLQLVNRCSGDMVDPDECFVDLDLDSP